MQEGTLDFYATKESQEKRDTMKRYDKMKLVLLLVIKNMVVSEVKSNFILDDLIFKFKEEEDGYV